MATKQGVNKMNKRLNRTALALFAAILLAANSGCHLHLKTVVPGYLFSFVAGWALGQRSVTETRECFLNGDPIACADVAG